MRFRICRSSDYSGFNKTPPCKNAVIVEEQEPIFDRIRDDNKWILCSTGDNIFWRYARNRDL